MLVDIGGIEELPTDRCAAVADGRAVAIRVADGVVAFPNRCLHQDSPLAGGWLRDGVFTCPLHFWRYRLDGELLSGPGGQAAGQSLAPLRVTIEAGRVAVEVPSPEGDRPVRERLLSRARDYDRAVAYETDLASRPPR